MHLKYFILVSLCTMFELGYNIMQRNKYIVLLQMSAALSKVCGKSEREVSRDKIQACRHIT
jgi:hypothetical protein